VLYINSLSELLVPAMRFGQVMTYTNRYNTIRVDVSMGLIVMVFNVEHVHCFTDAIKLIDFSC
jgi:hypothetical protein